MALTAAKDLPQLSLVDALELTVLVAHQEAAQTLRAMAERATSRRRAPQHCVKARARSWKAPWRSARRPAHFGPRL